MSWLRRLLGQPCQRGTLTLLDNNMTIVGFPPGWPISAADADSLTTLLNEWRATQVHRPLVLPWPVDVTDHRGQVYERTKP